MSNTYTSTRSGCAKGSGLLLAAADHGAVDLNLALGDIGPGNFFGTALDRGGRETW